MGPMPEHPKLDSAPTRCIFTCGCDSVLTSREEIFALLKANLLKAQIRMKKLADSKRRDLKFEVGSWVYLKLQPYRQVSVSGHISFPSSIDTLPPESVENSPLVTPLAVLDFKTVPVDDVPILFALVQWNGLSRDDMSWEKWQELKLLYDLEDKVFAEGDGIVMQDHIDESARPKRLVERLVGWSDFIHH
ncbi:hypothetical protein V8G54_015429 [Vigna mungo]|uniref:Uncharacterized protein n=1 Tax=Vigna mungo TaxID=3915 RepID=A0AAQ3RWU8_VIGMU